MNYNTGTLGLPIVLLVSLWGAVNTTLSLFRTLNERRDQVFDMIEECGKCPDKLLGPVEIYVTNMLPLSIGVCLFQSLICFVIISIPKYMNVEDDSDRHRMKLACYLIATLPGFSLLGFLGGGIFDAVLLSKSI